MDRTKFEIAEFVTQDEKVKSILNLLPKIAATDISVLIYGESGTGKEIIANIIHTQSKKANGQFVAVNCAALPFDLLEAELFGYKKGSFTGATHDHVGLFEIANGGTILLDEIGDMPLHLQAKLLRVIQQRKIRPIGATTERDVDIRILSATHRPLLDEIKAGRFREDLYYRLNGTSIQLPSLRDRGGDILALIPYFSELFARKYSLTVPKFSADSIKRICSYRWPGNVRQLENFIEQMTVLHQDKEVIEPCDFVFPDTMTGAANEMEEYFCKQNHLPTLAELTNRYIQYVYGSVKCHQGDAARVLGVSRRTVHRKIQELRSEVDAVSFDSQGVRSSG